jgi:hypothetical protein
MPVKANFNLDGIFGEIYRIYEEEIKPSIIEAVGHACMDTVSAAKQIDTYKDRTGNLRSSIGYVIYDSGQKIDSFFQANPVASGVTRENYRYETKEGIKTGVREVKTGGDGESGKKSGKDLAEEVAIGFPNGIVAIIVAGMDYALWVESNGLDVISGSCLALKSLLQEKMQIIRDIYKNG